MKYVKDKEWLLKNINDKKVRIVDCRFSLANPEKGHQEYLKSHLPCAVYFDLEKDLSSPQKVHGGRHPLPSIAEFINKLKKAGIDETTPVIAYDNGEGAFAARFWWLLHYLGHEQVYVLDGGFTRWLAANYPVTSTIADTEKAVFNVNIKSEFMASIEEVKEIVEKQQEDKILIDSREEKRYLGLEEPIDLKAGHIPGAINMPWMDGLSGGHYNTGEVQRQRFSHIDHDKQIIVYCGSGVTATPNYLALKEAGYDKVKLYVGSFSDWISIPENKIE